MSSNSGLYAEGHEPITMGDKGIVPPFGREVTIGDELGTVYGAFDSTRNVCSGFSQ